MVFCPHFELGMGEEKGRGQAICERYFSIIWSFCLFLFPPANSTFHEFPSALFPCLFYMQTTSMPLWTCEQRYCSAFNVKLNLNAFEKLLVGDCGHKLDFPNSRFFAYAWHGKVGKKGYLKLYIPSLFTPVNRSNFRFFLIFSVCSFWYVLSFSHRCCCCCFWMGCA